MDEILAMLAPYPKVLVLGCGSCVTVCLTGGEKQAEELASLLNLAGPAKGLNLRADFDCLTRQCDREFLANLRARPSDYDAVLSLACGVGVGFLSEQFPAVPVLPGLNTTFYGANVAEGVWAEYCHGCGDCVLAWTGGICPIARCSKSLLNGSCGGTNHGKCEVSAEMDCAWLKIYQRMESLGRLEELRVLRPPKDWSKDRGKGVRRLTHAELAAAEEEKAS